MGQILTALFSPQGLTPHGFCLLWDPGLIWLQAGADLLIAAAYFTIPLALVYFVRHRTDIAFGWVFWLFAAFITACGLTHLLSVVTLWQPYYWLEGAIKALTAVASVATAIILWPLLPRALALPSPSALQEMNLALEQQIAARDAASAQLLASEQQLRQAQKMEAIGRMTGGIAHDFNNMLTVILGSLEVAQEQLHGLQPTVLRGIDAATEAARRAASLTHRLLDFSRPQLLAPQIIDANQLVAGMSELLRHTLGGTHVVQTKLAADLWDCHTDSNQLENALLNLAVNARDAMPGGGKLTIETANATLPEGDYVMIAVSDTGTGMPPEVAAQIFDPFFTTKPPGQGTGLGLSQVFSFITQSGGQITVQTAPGAGTTLRLYLSRHTGSAAQGGTQPAAP